MLDSSRSQLIRSNHAQTLPPVPRQHRKFSDRKSFCFPSSSHSPRRASRHRDPAQRRQLHRQVRRRRPTRQSRSPTLKASSINSRYATCNRSSSRPSNDIVTLRNGKVYTGNYTGGSARFRSPTIRASATSFPTKDVASLVFTRTHPAASAGCRVRRRVIPVGTEITIRTDDTINARDSGTGQLYGATISQDVFDATNKVAHSRGHTGQTRRTRHRHRWRGAQRRSRPRSFFDHDERQGISCRQLRREHQQQTRGRRQQTHGGIWRRRSRDRRALRRHFRRRQRRRNRRRGRELAAACSRKSSPAANRSRFRPNRR